MSTKKASVAETTSETAPDTTYRRCTINTKRGLNLRPMPSMDALPLAVLQYGSEVNVVGESVENKGFMWQPVETSDGKSGYVQSKFLATINTQEE